VPHPIAAQDNQENVPNEFATSQPGAKSIQSELRNYRFIFKVVRLYKYDNQSDGEINVLKKYQ
jgi:hypothetical protein